MAPETGGCVIFLHSAENRSSAEKTTCGDPSLTVEPLSPAALRRHGAPDGRDGRSGGDADGTDRDEAETIRSRAGGARRKLGRILLCFVSRSLKSQVSEEICGRQRSSSMDQTSVYRIGRVRPMIRCQLHCLTDFGSLWRSKHIRQRLHQYRP